MKSSKKVKPRIGETWKHKTIGNVKIIKRVFKFLFAIEGSKTLVSEDFLIKRIK
jgi:hypothetical protein